MHNPYLVPHRRAKARQALVLSVASFVLWAFATGFLVIFLTAPLRNWWQAHLILVSLGVAMLSFAVGCSAWGVYKDIKEAVE